MAEIVITEFAYLLQVITALVTIPAILGSIESKTPAKLCRVSPRDLLQQLPVFMGADAPSSGAEVVSVGDMTPPFTAASRYPLEAV